MNANAQPDELILVLNHLCPDVLWPAALRVVHARHLDGLGLGVHVGVSHGGVQTCDSVSTSAALLTEACLQLTHTLLEGLGEDVLPPDGGVGQHLVLGLGLAVAEVGLPHEVGHRLEVLVLVLRVRQLQDLVQGLCRIHTIILILIMMLPTSK